MAFGASILFIASGAILTFALEGQVGFLDLDIVGWILMAAGALGLVMTTMVWGPRRSTNTRSTNTRSGATRVMYRETDDTLRDPPY